MGSRTLAIGDIHGCDVALETMIAELRPTTDDTVVVLGDVVDRGPNSKRCVELLLELRETCKFIFLMGNHEEMMLDACNMGDWANGWLEYGGLETLESYGCLARDVPERHLEFLRSGRDYFQTHQAIFVHANLQPNATLDRQTKQWLRWVHLSGNERPHLTGKRVICGHTRLPDGVPAVLDGWVNIDTFACGGKFLTCLDVGNDVVHQTTQTGDYHGAVSLDDIAVEFTPK